MLMSPDQGAVDHDVFLIGILGQNRQQVMPKTFFGPPAEPALDVFVCTENLREIAPGNARAISIQNRINEQTIIASVRSNMTNPTRQQIFDAVPLVVPNTFSQHGS